MLGQTQPRRQMFQARSSTDTAIYLASHPVLRVYLCLSIEKYSVISSPCFDVMLFCRSQNVFGSAIFFLLLWSILMISCNGYVDWIYPNSGIPNGALIFNYIDTVYFTWTSSISSPWMNMWCGTTTTAQSPTYGKTDLVFRGVFVVLEQKIQKKTSSAEMC